MKVAAVLVAAGRSERMGLNKLTMKLGNKMLINHVIEALEHSVIDDIVVVLGNNLQVIKQSLSSGNGRVKIAVNNDYEAGMVSSFKTGLRRVREADAVFLILGDQLILNPSLLDTMIEKIDRNKNAALIVSPVYKGKRGHPVLFSKALFSEILDLKGKQTLRSIIHKHLDKLTTIDSEKWTTNDIDTPEDFETAAKLWKKKYT